MIKHLPTKKLIHVNMKARIGKEFEDDKSFIERCVVGYCKRHFTSWNAK